MNFKQQTFITEYLRHRSAFTAYCLAYNVKDESNYESIMSAANRLLNNPEVGGVIDSVLSGIRHEVEQEVRAKLRTELLTTQRKREILAKIATGEMYAVQVYKGKDCSLCTQHVWPSINQMLKAIDLDNKMVGLYAPHTAAGSRHSAESINAQVHQQIDKFLQSMGMSVEPTENPTSEETATGAENSTATPTISNNNDNEETGDNTAGDTKEKNPADWQQSTTFVSPTGIIRLRTNPNKDDSEGTA